MEIIVYKEESYAVIGACFEVYNELGSGFLESVYHECLAIEFTRRQVPFPSRAALRLAYKGQVLEQTYTPDYVCFEKMIVEIKAVRNLADEHRAQVHNYLKAAGFKLGLLVNFGSYPKLEHERLVR